MLLHKLDHIARPSALLATPHSRSWGNNEFFFALVIMERTPANEISGCILDKLNAPTTHQCHQIDPVPDIFQIHFSNSPAHTRHFLFFAFATASGKQQGSTIIKLPNRWPATYHISVAQFNAGGTGEIRVSNNEDSSDAIS
jgi:hypothetical protein